MTEMLRLENVSRKFIIQHERNRSFEDAVVNMFRQDKSAHEEFWALKDVSFEVRKGETVGIIGENGSGKSTLLKLISRIMEPTTGRVVVNGKVSPLLELGTGFHPDLSGRDNVFLASSLLGFSRRETARKFDEIVGFAGIEQFIDVPVKHYSSGMYARLAFAVAISVDPDILLIDEVLSVGDAAFQEKCIEKIFAFQRIGKTIVFVSHSLETVRMLCSRAVWLEHGEVRSVGESKKVALDYLRRIDLQTEVAAREKKSEVEAALEAGDTKIIQIRDVKILSGERMEKHTFQTGEDIVIRAYYRVQAERLAEDCTFAVSINERNGGLVHQAMLPFTVEQAKGGAPKGLLELKYPGIPLRNGLYHVSVAVWPNSTPDFPLDVRHQEYKFTIEGSRLSQGPEQGQGIEDGIISLKHVWQGTGIRLEAATNVSAEIVLAGLPAHPSHNGDGDWPSIGGHECLPTHVYIGQNDAACLQEGWHGVEGDIPTFRWAAGRASLLLYVPENATKLMMKASDPGALVRDVRGSLSADGIQLGEFEIRGTGARTLTFPLPDGCRGTTKLAIEARPLLMPSELGLSADGRELGLVVEEIWSE